jgi:uncharacterized protein YwgA
LIVHATKVRVVSVMYKMGNYGNYRSGVTSEVSILINVTGILHWQYALSRKRTKYRFSDVITMMDNLLTRVSYLTKCMM